VTGQSTRIVPQNQIVLVEAKLEHTNDDLGSSWIAAPMPDRVRSGRRALRRNGHVQSTNQGEPDQGRDTDRTDLASQWRNDLTTAHVTRSPTNARHDGSIGTGDFGITAIGECPVNTRFDETPARIRWLRALLLEMTVGDFRSIRAARAVLI